MKTKECDLQTLLTVLMSEGGRKVKTCSSMTGCQNFFTMAACLQTEDTSGNALMSSGQSGTLSLVNIQPDTVLSLVEPYYAGAKEYAITTH